MSDSTSPAFARRIGIDYSGAENLTSGLKGLRVFMADRTSSPVEVEPAPSPRKYMDMARHRRVADRTDFGKPARALVGIDSGFSLPLRYFETHRLARRWAAFFDGFVLE